LCRRTTSVLPCLFSPPFWGSELHWPEGRRQLRLYSSLEYVSHLSPPHLRRLHSGPDRDALRFLWRARRIFFRLVSASRPLPPVISIEATGCFFSPPRSCEAVRLRRENRCPIARIFCDEITRPLCLPPGKNRPSRASGAMNPSSANPGTAPKGCVEKLCKTCGQSAIPTRRAPPFPQ
jgi:hypothetical protein